MHANIQTQNENRRNWPWGLGRNHRAVIPVDVSQPRRNSVSPTKAAVSSNGDFVRRVVRIAKSEGTFQFPCCGQRQRMTLEKWWWSDGLRCNCLECKSKLLILFDPDNQAAIKPLNHKVPTAKIDVHGGVYCPRPKCNVWHSGGEFTPDTIKECWRCKHKFLPVHS